MKKFYWPQVVLFVPVAFLALFVSCATVNPDADVLVVRTEQAQAGALATFDFIIYMDHSNRTFWRTNAPAFHAFAEWLRTPQSYGTSEVPRAVAIQLNLDDLKQTYKFARTSANSNALWAALQVLNAAVAQSWSWSNIITSPIHP